MKGTFGWGQRVGCVGVHEKRVRRDEGTRPGLPASSIRVPYSDYL